MNSKKICQNMWKLENEIDKTYKKMKELSLSEVKDLEKIRRLNRYRDGLVMQWNTLNQELSSMKKV